MPKYEIPAGSGQFYTTDKELSTPELTQFAQRLGAPSADLTRFAQEAGIPPPTRSIESSFPSGGGGGPISFAPLRDILTAFTGYPSGAQMGATGGALAADALRLAGRASGPAGTALTLAAPAIGGAIGGAVEQRKDDPLSGAVEGGLIGAAMGLPGSVVNYMVNRRYSRVAEQSGLAKILTDHFPSLSKLGQVVTNKIDRLHTLLVGETGEKLVSRRLNSVKDAIGSRLSTPVQHVFPVPSLEESKIADLAGLPKSLGTPQFSAAKDQQLFTFEQADNLITKLHHRSYTIGSGEPRGTVTGPEMREWAHNAVQEVAAEIAKTDPELAKEYLAARQEFANIREIGSLIGKPGVIAKNRLNLGTVQKEIMDDPGLYRRLKRTPMGRDVLDWAFRGAPPTAADVAGGVGLGVSAHAELGVPRFWAHPHMPRQVGRQPMLPLRYPTMVGVRGAMKVLGPEEAQAQQDLTEAVRSGQTPPLGAIRRLATDPKSGLTSVQRRRLLGILPPTPLPAAPSVR